MPYKTLILIDNSSELNEVNRATIREVVKYIIENVDEDNQIAIAVTGEKAEYLTDYEDSENTQKKTIESLEYTDTNVPGVDVLMDVLLNWKSGDLACRDILYMSGRSVSAGSEYTEEELLFEVSSKEYPIYSLACIQNDNNACVKNMNSLSRISGGIGINTEDTQSDAEIERQLGDMLLSAMRENRTHEMEKYEEQETADDTINNDLEVLALYEGDYDSNDEYSDIEVINDEAGTENLIYEQVDEMPFLQGLKPFAIPVIAIILVTLIFAISIEIRNRRYKREDERFKQSFRNTDRNAKIVEKVPFERMPVSDDIPGDTVYLAEYDDSDTGTRLLYQTKEGIEITLEDRANPTKYFRACVRDSIVIGRNEKMCDVAVTYDDSISSRHCELFLRDNSLYCRDLGSSNGTMVNKKKVYQEMKLESGDILRIGRLSFFLQILGDSYE